ncbi:MAG TPA: hypothetical protein VGQ83_22070 [Polyangia bacterium]|jgi:hypothetical protein
MDPRHLRIEGYFARDPEHSVESLRQAFAQAGLDGAWLRVAPVRAASNGGAALGWLVAEVTGFGSDQLLASQEALRTLSSKGRTVFLLSYSGDEDRVVYEAYRDGARVGGWEGVRREFPTTIEPEAGAEESDDDGRGTQGQRAFDRTFRAHTELDFKALLGSDAAWPILDHATREATEAFFLGRRLQVPAGTPKLLDLFRFHDRTGQAGDRMAFMALDIAAATRLLEGAPAATLAQLLGRLDEGAAFRLGPFMHAVKEVAAEVEAMPAEKPVAAAHPSLDLVELVQVVHTGGCTAGDGVDYFDHVFFPLLNLYDPAQLPPLGPEELTDLEDAGVLAAMAEVLPYNAPEGQLLESLADAELRPLAPAYAEEGEYDGSIYLVTRDRLRTLLTAFDGPRLMEQVEKFLSAWFRAIDPEATDAAYGAWRRGRDHLDRDDVDRFAQTLAELRAVVGLCDTNGLELGLVFYEA